jgi:eukaryotic-like serine/threonine-protein kinase
LNLAAGSRTLNGHPSVTVGQHSQAGRKPRNDDSYGVLIPKGTPLEAKGIAMAIADGMSSSEGAKAASETCVKNFLEDYYATPESWTVKKSVALVLRAVNNWLHAQGHAIHNSDQGMVCTFSGAVLKSGTVHIFHAGDSRISLLRNGQLEPLTREHKMRGGGQQYLARAIGINPDVEIDYRSEAVEPGDCLIFTTDGVHEHVPPAVIVNCVAHYNADLDEAAKSIVDAAYAGGSGDNLTCQIIRVDHPGRADASQHLSMLQKLPFPPELAPGMSFDGYQILRELHTSKRTQVYLAKDQTTGITVVLKTPSVNFEDDAGYLEMFTREDWIGRLVASPHVLKFIAPDRPRRHLYHVTEYFDGQTLRQWMHDNPKPDLASVRVVVEQIAKGLRAFHRKDIIHQDLKPENIMIDRNGLVKVIDFGSSRAASHSEGTIDAKAPALVGTLDYTAPEYHQGEPGSNRSDIYSLGVIGYEMLTGKLPYAKGFANARDVKRRTYTSAQSIRDDIPVWVDAALAKAVAKRPSERTEALSALVEDLGRPNASLGYDRPRPLVERNPLAFWQGLCALLVLASVILLYLVSRQ